MFLKCKQTALWFSFHFRLWCVSATKKNEQIEKWYISTIERVFSWAHFASERKTLHTTIANLTAEVFGVSVCRRWPSMKIGFMRNTCATTAIRTRNVKVITNRLVRRFVWHFSPIARTYWFGWCCGRKKENFSIARNSSRKNWFSRVFFVVVKWSIDSIAAVEYLLFTFKSSK